MDSRTKVQTVKGRAPTADEKRWMDEVSGLGCIVCLNIFEQFSSAEIHHIDGKTKENAHFLVLPLCTLHHRGGDQAGLFISRHPWKSRFQNAYGTEEELWSQVCNRLERKPCEFRW